MFLQFFKNTDDILHKDAVLASEVEFTERTSGLSFLRCLDATKKNNALESEEERKISSHILNKAYTKENDSKMSLKFLNDF